VGTMGTVRGQPRPTAKQLGKPREKPSSPQTKERATSSRVLGIDAGRAADFDPWSGWEDPRLPPHPLIDEQGLATALRAVLRYGLPLTTRKAGVVLPSLRSVIARSIHPYDVASRVDALNRLLVRFIVELDEERGNPSLAILFATARGTRGTTLQARRERTAELLSYDVTHFRKRIEPKLIDELASALYADLLRYKRRVRRAPMSEEPTGDTPSITDQDFTHQEELVSRIWQHVYGLRAELIAVGRMETDPAYASQAEDHRRAAVRERATVNALMREFVETYGELFLRHGDAEWSGEVIRRLCI
jgi:hypothetical protein